LITHDLSFARALCDRIAVMYCGQIVEISFAKMFFEAPLHPYVQALFESLPDRGLKNIPGEAPSMINPPGGCRFHPRWKIYDSATELMRIHNLSKNGPEEKKRVLELLEVAGLKEEHLDRYPHELSGGELQRVMIARAISPGPEFIVADEPTSMLDVSIQAQILNLLLNLQERFGVAYLFITHDLEIARRMSNRIAMIFAGQIIEVAEAEELFRNPLHPYTRSLLKSTDLFNNQNGFICKESGIYTRQGCKYYFCCRQKNTRCREELPQLAEVSKKHRVRCFHLLGVS